MEQLRREEVLARIPELAGLDLAGLDLSAVDLRDADLSGAELTGARFDGSDLHHASLERVKGSGASFRDAKLHGTRLEGADFAGADFSNADLSHTDWSNANWEGCQWSGALFEGAKVSPELLAAAGAQGADLSQVQLIGEGGKAPKHPAPRVADEAEPVLDDGALLDQFEDLLRAVAEQVGDRSVAPHVITLDGHLTRHQQLLSEHARQVREVAEAQRQAVQATEAQAAQRELDATDILQSVRDLLDQGLAANRSAFDGAVDDLWQRLAEHAAAADRQMQALGEVTARVEGGVLKDAQQLEASVEQAARQVEQGATRLETALTAHQRALDGTAGKLAGEMAELGRVYNQTAATALEQAAAREQQLMQLVVELQAQQDSLAQQLAQTREELAHTLVQGLKKLASHDDQIVAALNEINEYLQRPKGLGALLWGDR